MKKRALAVMLAGALTLGAQTGVWAASDTSDQKEGERRRTDTSDVK